MRTRVLLIAAVAMVTGCGASTVTPPTLPPAATPTRTPTPATPPPITFISSGTVTLTNDDRNRVIEVSVGVTVVMQLTPIQPYRWTGLDTNYPNVLAIQGPAPQPQGDGSLSVTFKAISTGDARINGVQVADCRGHDAACQKPPGDFHIDIAVR